MRSNDKDVRKNKNDTINIKDTYGFQCSLEILYKLPNIIGQNFINILLNQTKNIFIVPEVQCPFCNLKKTFRNIKTKKSNSVK